MHDKFFLGLGTHSEAATNSISDLWDQYFTKATGDSVCTCLKRIQGFGAGSLGLGDSILLACIVELLLT